MASKPKPTKEPASIPHQPPVKVVSAEEVQRIRTVLEHPDMVNHSIGRLLAIMRQKGAELPSKDEEDFAYAALVGLAPKDPAEIMLCQQLIAAHEMSMAMLTRCKQAEYMNQVQEYGNLGVKLMGLYERLFQTLVKARKPQQVVEVQHTHKHIHVNAQTVPGTGDMKEIEGQAHGAIDPRALALAAGPALLGEDPPRDALPIPTDEARQVPSARRRSRDRRASGTKER